MNREPRTLELLGAEPVAADRLLTATEVATILGVRPKRVYELDVPYVQLSVRAKRWRRTDLEAWIAAHRRIA